MLELRAFQLARFTLWERAATPGESHGRSTEQEVALEAWHAPRAQRIARSGHGGRADDWRSPSAPPHQPHRFLPRPQGPEDQGGRLIPSSRCATSPGLRIAEPGVRI